MFWSLRGYPISAAYWQFLVIFCGVQVLSIIFRGQKILGMFWGEVEVVIFWHTLKVCVFFMVISNLFS